MAARFDMDFKDVLIEQGTKGQIISQKGDPLLVKWDGIGERPAAPSQLIPVAPINDEEVFYPKVTRKAEVQTSEKKKKKEVVAEGPVLSIARMEENRAKEAEVKNKGQGKGQAKGKGKKGKADVTV